MELWGITDRGKKRKDNQDTFRILSDEDNDVAVLVVCDGCGGMRAGNIASTIAAEMFVNHIAYFLETSSDPSLIAAEMAEAVHYANKTVYEKSIQFPEYSGMGTTLTAVVSTTAGEVVANVGDSRAYHLTSEFIRQITKDHTFVEEMIARGDITRAQARNHTKKNLITRVVGTNEKETPDIFSLNLKKGECIFMCSDGLTDLIIDDEILSEFQHGSSAKQFCERLIKRALSRGAPDNVTAILYKK
jgi:protein phosphatase